MVVLSRALAVSIVLAGCYAPDVRDCTVTCSASTDCADGQQCAGGYCVADRAPTTCAHDPASPDAGVVVPVPATTSLHITIKGRGHVVLGGVIVCRADGGESAPGADCTVVVPRNELARALAVAAPGGMFKLWTSVACPSADQPSCDFTPATATMLLGVQFK